jgi:hypothetical protein
VFVPGRPFQTNLMVAGKGGAYPTEVLHSRVGSKHYQQRLRLKGLQRPNSSFLRTFVNYGRKKFYQLGPKVDILIIFINLDTLLCKLDRFKSINIFSYVEMNR